VQVDDASPAPAQRGVEPSKSLEDSMLALLSSVDTNAPSDQTPTTDGPYFRRPSPSPGSSFARHAHASPPSLVRRLDEFGSPPVSAADSASDAAIESGRKADVSGEGTALGLARPDWNTPEAIAFSSIDARAHGRIGVAEIISSLKSLPHVGALLGIPQSLLYGEDAGRGLEAVLRAHVGDRLLDVADFGAVFGQLRVAWSPHKVAPVTADSSAHAASGLSEFRVATGRPHVPQPAQGLATRESPSARRSIGEAKLGNAAGELAAALQDYLGVLGEDRKEVIWKYCRVLPIALLLSDAVGAGSNGGSERKQALNCCDAQATPARVVVAPTQITGRGTSVQ
jgi:hypothetical protein